MALQWRLCVHIAATSHVEFRAWRFFETNKETCGVVIATATDNSMLKEVFYGSLRRDNSLLGFNYMCT